MLAKALLEFGAQFHFDSIELLDHEIRVVARVRGKTARCPDCRCRSSLVHSRYVRSIRDLPISGKNVSLLVRKDERGHSTMNR
jgi:transposase